MKTALSLCNTVISIAVIAIFTLAPVPALAQVIDPGTPIAGLSQNELAARWWQWAMPLPVGPGPDLANTSTNPMVETHGSASHLGNNFVPGVSFLAGVFSNLAGTDTAVRTMHIPVGNTLFLPIVNSVVDNTNFIGFPPTNFTINGMLTGDFGVNFVASLQNPTSLFLSIDGVPVNNLSNHFQVNGDDGFLVTYTQNDNIISALGADPTLGTNVYPSIVPTGSVGYWVGLTLSQGSHTIRFGGEVPMLDPNGQPLGFSFGQNITYNVHVGAPEPGTCALVGFVGLCLGGVIMRRNRKS